jgi:hypothetical protein
MEWVFLVTAALWVGPCLAQNTISKADLLRMTREHCPTDFLKNKRFIDLLLIRGGTLTSFCDCLVPRFASQVDDADYGNENALARKWADSVKFCLAVSIK